MALSDGQDADSAGLPRDETELFLVLEGGGARGIAHVAAWEVLDELVSKPKLRLQRDLPADLGGERFCLTAVAGASAGAIVAAFIAAGAKAQDLIDEDGRVPLRSSLGIEYFYDLFGVREWRRLKHLRWLQGPSGLLAREAKRFMERHALFKPAPPRLPFWQRLPVMFPTIDVFATIIGLCTVLSVFYFWLDDADIFKTRGAEEAVFLLLWFIANIAFGVSNLVLRIVDIFKRWLNRRHFSGFLRFPFHPAVTIFLSLVATAYLTRWLASFPSLKMAYASMIGYSLPVFDRQVPVFLLALRMACGFAVGVTVVSAMRRFFKGTVSVTNMERDLDAALREIVRRHAERSGLRIDIPQGRSVTFDDLHRATGLSLSIVTSDVIRNEVVVYSTEEHSGFPVARAVTASLAIPFAFRSVSDGPRILFDGGLISSLPAWVFRRHRTRDPDSRILAVGIESDEYDTWIPSFFAERDRRVRRRERRRKNVVSKFVGRHLGKLSIICVTPRISLFWPLRIAVNVASTAAFGGRSLDLDFSDRLENFSLQPRVGLLDFDMPAADAKKEIALLKQEADIWITNLLWRRKTAFRSVCQTIEASLRSRGNPQAPLEGGRIRAFWAERDGAAKAVRIKFTYGFAKDHLDDRLVLPYGYSMTALAAETGNSQFADATTLTELLGQRMNRYRDIVKWQGRAWCWAMPVHDANGILQGVLAVESDLDLSRFDPVIGAAGAARSALWTKEDGTLHRDAVGRLQPQQTKLPESPMTQLEADWKTLVNEKFVKTKTPLERTLERRNDQPTGITSRIYARLLGFGRGALAALRRTSAAAAPDARRP